MINNGWGDLDAALVALVLVAASGVAGCKKVSADIGDRYQGIVELDERVLGFELPGRVSAVDALRGAPVHAGDRLATLDPELATTARAARQSDADAARAALALVKAGSRGEEVRSMQAQVRAAKASEDLLQKSLAREQALRARNASTDAAVEDLQGRLDRAVGERQSVEQRLAELVRGARTEERTVAEARLAAATAAVELEEQRIQRHVLLAPADGVILDVHSKSGEVVAAGTPVATLGDTKHPFADVFVPQAKLAGLKVGVRAEVRVDGEAAPFLGVVETVAQRTEFTPRFLFSARERPNLVVRLRVRIEDPAERLHAGVPAFVAFQPGGAVAK
jgi:HlyD family secretion protein